MPGLLPGIARSLAVLACFPDTTVQLAEEILVVIRPAGAEGAGPARPARLLDICDGSLRGGVAQQGISRTVVGGPVPDGSMQRTLRAADEQPGCRAENPEHACDHQPAAFAERGEFRVRRHRDVEHAGKHKSNAK